MSKLHQLFASAALGLGLALTATVASAVNPVINGNFKILTIPNRYGHILGWDVRPYVNPPGIIVGGPVDPNTIGFQSNVYDNIPFPGTTATHYGRFDCQFNCKKDLTQSISQMITGLEQNKTYTISFYIQAYSAGESYAAGQFYSPIPPFEVSLGSQTAPPILMPTYSNATGAPVLKKSVTFTYTDPGSSALLTFTQHFSGEYLPPKDIPLTMNTHAEDTIFLSLIGDGIVEEPSQGPTLSVQKALSGNRGANTDQFTVQILKGSTVVNSTANSTTSGSGSTVTGGTTGSTTLVAGTSYTIAEVGNGTTRLGAYNSTLSCTNAAGTTVPTALNTAFTLSDTDKVSCTLTNKTKPATLTLRQAVQSPLPVNLVPPYTISYAGTNGWTSPALTNNVPDNLLSGNPMTLSAFNTDTRITATFPDARYYTNRFSCQDTNFAASGNPSTILVSATTNSITIPAANVLPGAALRCTMLAGHTTP
jgi:hypothetical protein